jgi:probable HAF family extracellular repeat protein
MSRARSRSALAAATLGMLLFSTAEGRRAAALPGPYVVTDLGTLGGLSAQGYDLNAAGHVVGYATTSASLSHAFVWRDGVMSDLGTLGGGHSDANAINDLGQVVGRSRLNTSSQTHAVLWDNGAKIDLTPGVEQAVANGINNRGQIVGTRNHWIAFMWEGGVIRDLPHLGGGGGFAADINDAGQAVGSSYTTHVTDLGAMAHAVLWESGTATDLGVLPGEQDSGASAINSVGQIVGSSGSMDPETYEVTSRPFLYQNGAMTALPVPSPESYAADINDDGVVVGTMRAWGGPSRYHAFVYADGVATNLNTLVLPGSGLHLAFAYGINNAGQIAGVALDAQYRYHAFLLTPAPADAPVVNIGNASVTEGHAGATSIDLTLTLSTPSAAPIAVAYATGNASAAAGSDYGPASGTVTFEPGQTSKTISVLVNGDRSGEANETFVVNLTQAWGGAVIADGQGSVTIVDDEPRVSVSDLSRNEGHSGTTQFTFTVGLSASSAAPISVAFATADGSARSTEDYDARTGVLSFASGETAKTVTVSVRGDRRREGDEVFSLNLSAAVGAFLADTQGTAVVRNDDR